MGRKKAESFEFTRASVERAQCPEGRAQAFYWDTVQPELGLRVTSNGARAFIFEGKLGRQTVRLTVGPATMKIRAAKDRRGKPLTEGADVEAARLGSLLRQGIDPRAEKAAKIAQQRADRETAKVERMRDALSALEAWRVYCSERAATWGARHLADHQQMVSAGGEERKRSSVKVKVAGPLYSLLSRPLAEVDAEAVESWLEKESKSRPTRASLAFRMLRSFVNWCAEHPDFRSVVHTDACKGRRVRDKLVKPGEKKDALQSEQLASWFAEVRKLAPVPAAYLQALLLTGARREELAALRWEDIDFRWGSLRIRDKVEGERTIPLTPYVATLLRGLKARNEVPPKWPRRLCANSEALAKAQMEWKPSPWVFASRAAANGRLQEPRIGHNRALHAAGLPHI
ncbi:MAG: tyrosine-type recombinase/integrase, partial [Nitrospira sp.]|nr:tyrosine-type recombinase/integrase [Nitrospira sp.]